MHINAFPPEILINIFEQGKSTQPLEIGGSDLLFAASQVCVSWRALAHAYPHLWDDLRLSSRSSPQKAKNLLARYGGPTITVAIDRRTPPPDHLAYWNMLNALTAHAARWRALRFVGPIASVRVLSRACVRHTFPALRDLAVMDPDPPPDAHPHQLSINAPNLVSLSFLGTMPSAKTNYPRLRELRLNHSLYFLYFHQLDGFIEPQLLDLESLGVTASPLPLLREPMLHPTDSCIVSLTLCSLRTADVAPGALTTFLHLVRMPLLQHLEISNLGDHLLTEFLKSLRHVAHASPKYPLLRSLTLRGLELSGVDAESFHAVESVSNLCLTEIDVTPVVRLLERYDGVFPRIREIQLAGGETLRLPSRAANR